MLRRAIIRFYWQQLLKQFLPQAVHDCSPDANHPHRRRFTKGYHRRMSRVKNLWLVTLSSWLFIPLPPFWVASGLFTTLLSFAVLDETG
jgi:hypothetical protein